MIAALSAALASLTACHQFEVDARAGYAQMSLSGDIGLDSTGSGLVTQDIESAFGLGEDMRQALLRRALRAAHLQN